LCDRIQLQRTVATGQIVSHPNPIMSGLKLRFYLFINLFFNNKIMDTILLVAYNKVICKNETSPEAIIQ
jgi:hypothetical protein